MKKLFSLVMALTMTALLCVSAFATGSSGTGSSGTGAPPVFTANAQVASPVIDVRLTGTTGNVYLNPNGFTLKASDASAIAPGDTTTTADQKTSAKVFSAPYVLVNNTSMDLDVYVNGKATLGASSTMILAKAKPDDSSVKKEALIYAAFGSVSGDSATAANLKVAPASSTFNADNPGTNFLLQATELKTAQKVGKLVKSTGTEWGTQGKYGFIFAGDCVADPTIPWDSSKDTVSATLTFTFKAASAS